MAKHLRPRDIDAIVDIIIGWPTEKLTWQGICEAASNVIGSTPTRQTLNAHATIKATYDAKKSGLKIHGPRTAMPSSLAAAAQRIARLQSENDDLRSRNDALLEQFVKWQYNAYKRGVKGHQLNEDLPRIDRERTEDANIPK
ncbi:hypothetical protein [Rhodoferax sp. BLA1]|uniref:hypothetical protein n=1 Tax=Rhodoferax sp. BLA1 TaxID=2576062 RepID=UPI0015D36BC8|nr:hypothetical protein [Rhodoferax sp. BLA1]